MANAGLIYANDSGATFDGSSSVSAGYDAAYALPSAFSIAAIFSISSSVDDWVRIVGPGNRFNSHYGLWYHQPRERLLFQSDGAGRLNAPYYATVALNTEFYIMGVLDDSRSKLFIDGVELASASFHSIHCGTINDVALWNAALSTTEVANYAQTGLATFIPEPVPWYLLVWVLWA